MTCKDFQDKIVEALYDELNGEKLTEFSHHKDNCKTCASLFEGMNATVLVMKKRKYPEMEPTFSSELWDKIEPYLAPEKRRKIRTIFTLRPAAVPLWTYGLAALLLIAAGIYLGRNYFTSPSELHSLPAAGSQTASLDSDTATTQALLYLQRSKNFLLSIVNTASDEEPVLNHNRQQNFSRQLVDQADVLYTALNRPDQQQLRRLIDDLRIILLQLANIEVKPGVPAVELVRKSIDKKSILLKINIEELRAMTNRPTNNENNKDKNI